MENETGEQTPQIKSHCLNCDHELHEKDKFCPHCGQKNNNGKIRMKELLSRFWTHLVHLDSKFVKVSWQLLIPGKVTAEYFKGRHKRYPHPVQFFFIIMFFFLFLFNKSCSNRNMRFNNTNGNFGVHVGTEKMEDNISTERFTQAMEHYAKRLLMLKQYESLSGNAKESLPRKTLDTLLTKTYPDAELVRRIFSGINDADSTQVSTEEDSVNLSMINYQKKVAIIDIYSMTPAEIADLYKVTNWQERLLLEQGIKSFRNPKELMHNYLGSFTWTILVLIALMAGLLALLYWPQKRYYVEHFVFLMHQHSGAYLVITLALALNLFYSIGVGWLLILLWVGLHLLWCMKSYYGESWPRTILKWLLYIGIYIFGFTLLFAVGMMLVFILL